MYILNAKIENIRSIRRFELKLEPEQCPGWHVLIGDNGAGKTSMVRALALGLVGRKHAGSLLEDWTKWIYQPELVSPSKTNSLACVSLGLMIDQAHDFLDGDFIPPQTIVSEPLLVAVHGSKVMNVAKHGAFLAKPVREGSDGEKIVVDEFGEIQDSITDGWFAASFGPFRRFTGGDSRYDKLFESHPRVAAHLSAFGEDIAFTHISSWLQDLRFKQLEANEEANSGLLGDVRHFINGSHLLPHDTILEEVTSDEVVFRDGNGCKVDINQLSDGYRSVLSLTFELIRQLVRTYGRAKVFVREGDSVKPQIELPGVVIVDEIDAHLHPTWQRRIGMWFTERFPKLQFIVTTHSPLICQAAEKGSVWRLPTPGVENDGGQITGTELKRLIYGNVLEAYGTEAFGSDVNRSESSQEKMKRLAQLNQKSLRESLSVGEKAELIELRSILPTSAGALDTTEGGVR